MAMNPMQKKARTSFLLGMFLTLIITGLIIVLLITQLGKIKKEQAAVQYKNVYVLKQDVASGGLISDGMPTLSKVEANNVPSNAVTDTNMVTYITDTATAKIELTMGTVLTTDMINIDGQADTPDKRLQEYNMLILPSRLEQGETIDIRLRLPTGEDYIVLSKKYVEETDSSTVWLKVGEDEILTMSNAIVEAYVMEGSLLYATTYVDAGMQGAAVPTYIANSTVVELMNDDPNITAVAKAALAARYTTDKTDQRNVINNQLGTYADDATANVENHVEEEAQRQQSARQQYIDSLGL